MDKIFHQLGALALGSVPTIFLFLLLIVAYEVLVRRPLERTLNERRIRTVGAVEQARGALAAAEAEMSVYEDKLRAAKAELFTDREQRLKRWSEDREVVLNEIRQLANEHIKDARREIEESAAGARVQIEAVSDELSAKILQALLPKRASLPEVGQ